MIQINPNYIEKDLIFFEQDNYFEELETVLGKYGVLSDIAFSSTTLNELYQHYIQTKDEQQLQYKINCHREDSRENWLDKGYPVSRYDLLLSNQLKDYSNKTNTYSTQHVTTLSCQQLIKSRELQ